MFLLPKLSYGFDALDPFLDAKALEIHVLKHHQAYIDNLNQALQVDVSLQNLTLPQLYAQLPVLPSALQVAIRNNAGGHLNHSLFWQMMTPKSKVVHGLLYQEIVKKFGAMVTFQEKFVACAKSHFASGWAWLVLNHKGELEIYSLPNQDTPLLRSDVALLCLDVWEHAYYLNYQNRRIDYIQAWWNVVNWEFVEEQYRQAIGK